MLFPNLGRIDKSLCISEWTVRNSFSVWYVSYSTLCVRDPRSTKCKLKRALHSLLKLECFELSTLTLAIHSNSMPRVVPALWLAPSSWPAATGIGVWGQSGMVTTDATPAGQANSSRVGPMNASPTVTGIMWRRRWWWWWWWCSGTRGGWWVD